MFWSPDIGNDPKAQSDVDPKHSFGDAWRVLLEPSRYHPKTVWQLFQRGIESFDPQVTGQICAAADQFGTTALARTDDQADPPVVPLSQPGRLALLTAIAAQGIRTNSQLQAEPYTQRADELVFELLLDHIEIGIDKGPEPRFRKRVGPAVFGPDHLPPTYSALQFELENWSVLPTTERPGKYRVPNMAPHDVQLAYTNPTVQSAPEASVDGDYLDFPGECLETYLPQYVTDPITGIGAFLREAYDREAPPHARRPMYESLNGITETIATTDTDRHEEFFYTDRPDSLKFEALKKAAATSPLQDGASTIFGTTAEFLASVWWYLDQPPQESAYGRAREVTTMHQNRLRSLSATRIGPSLESQDDARKLTLFGGDPFTYQLTYEPPGAPLPRWIARYDPQLG